MEIQLGEDFLKEIEKIREEENSKITEEERIYIEEGFDCLCNLVLALTKKHAKDTIKKDLEQLKKYTALEKQSILSKTANYDFIKNFMFASATICTTRGDKLLWLNEECSRKQS